MCPGVNSYRLFAAAGVAGVDNSNNDATRQQEALSLFQRSDSGLRPGNAALVAARQVSQIEHYCLNRLTYQCTKLFVSCVQQSHLLDTIIFVKQGSCCVQCLRLNIKGKHLTSSTNEPGEKKGVIAVATGGIHHPVARPDFFPQQKMTQVNCISQMAQTQNDTFSVRHTPDTP